jgi:hypothetical protein
VPRLAEPGHGISLPVDTMAYAGNPGRAKEVVDQINSVGDTLAAFHASVVDEADICVQLDVKRRWR